MFKQRHPSKKPSLDLLPFPSSSSLLRHVFYIILYCTVLSTSGEFILLKLTCVESLTGRAGMNPTARSSLVFFAASSKVVFTQSRLHMAARLEKTKKNKKTADESRNSSQKSSQYFCAGILDTPPPLSFSSPPWTIEMDHCTPLQHRTKLRWKEINPHKKLSLVPFPPSSLCHIFYISKIQDGCKKQKTLEFQKSKNSYKR